jgi:hippurate hydrolase
MDALPIVEETGLPFASKVKVELGDGSHVGVMHACGHDMHQTVLVATAQTLVALKDRWKGTVVFIAQPAEEIGAALAMIEDGLHTLPPITARLARQPRADGTVGYARLGLGQRGLGRITPRPRRPRLPHASIDPVVTAAR